MYNLMLIYLLLYHLIDDLDRGLKRHAIIRIMHGWTHIQTEDDKVLPINMFNNATYKHDIVFPYEAYKSLNYKTFQLHI